METKKTQVFVCPKCGSTNWQVTYKPPTESKSLFFVTTDGPIIGMRECLDFWKLLQIMLKI